MQLEKLIDLRTTQLVFPSPLAIRVSCYLLLLTELHMEGIKELNAFNQEMAQILYHFDVL
jgi:hypothetical protein